MLSSEEMEMCDMAWLCMKCFICIGFLLLLSSLSILVSKQLAWKINIKMFVLI